METSRGALPRSSHLQVSALGALKKWGKWSLGITKASLPGVFLCAPARWGPSGTHRIWKWQAPASVLNDAPAALRNAL